MPQVIYTYLVKVYALLVSGGRYDLEPTIGSNKPLVPEEYRELVAEYLADLHTADGLNRR